MFQQNEAMVSKKQLQKKKPNVIVKMDYSETYRENERLEVHLDERLTHLAQLAHRVLSEKEEELELVRTDASRLRKLRKAIKGSNKEESSASQTVLKSAPRISRRISELSSASTGESRVRAEASSSSSRRTSVVSNAYNSKTDVNGLGETSSTPQDSTVVSNGDISDTRHRSLPERRLALIKDQFSSKNLFNVTRKNNSITQFVDTRTDLITQDSLRKAMSAMNISGQQLSLQDHGRPSTSYQSSNLPRGFPSGFKPFYYRPKTSPVSRCVRFTDSSLSIGYGNFCLARRQRPRSRRELQKLSRLSPNSFEDEVKERPETCAINGNLQELMLERLRCGRPQLQARVSAFVQDMEEFNKRAQKSGLEQILEGR